MTLLLSELQQFPCSGGPSDLRSLTELWFQKNGWKTRDGTDRPRSTSMKCGGKGNKNAGVCGCIHKSALHIVSTLLK